MTVGRLIIDPPAPGSWNMAMDQALLEAADRRQQITLRFYQWSKPTLSLGYFQKTADRQSHVPSLNCSLVRRSSGGGAILHDHELTYSICVPESNRWSKSGNDLYDLVHLQISLTLADFGIKADLVSKLIRSSKSDQDFLCFQRRANGDVVVESKKVCGSAQRRVRDALLQHGSLLLKKSDAAPELPGLEELTGKSLNIEFTYERLTMRLAKAFGIKFVNHEASSSELAEANRIEHERFLTDNWNHKR